MSRHARTPTQASIGSTPLYATFPRRLNALSVDALVIITWSAVVLGTGAQLERAPLARSLLFVFWVALALTYEPFLVSYRGATIGHSLLNLCVRDNQTGHHIPLFRAVLRTFLKGALGLPSFFIMNFSRRHQALHDILTGSSVCIRNVAKAHAHHYWTRPSDQPKAV